MERSGNPVKICVRRSRTQPRRSRAIAFTPLEFLLSIYSPNLQSVQGRTPACGNRSFPLRCGGCGGHPPHIARTRATDSSHTSHRLLGGVSRRRCPSHTTIIPPAAGIKYVSGSRTPLTAELRKGSVNAANLILHKKQTNTSDL